MKVGVEIGDRISAALHDPGERARPRVQQTAPPRSESEESAKNMAHIFFKPPSDSVGRGRPTEHARARALPENTVGFVYAFYFC